MKQFFTRKAAMLLLCFLIFGASKTYSQTTVILNENFSGGSGSTPPTGWTNNIISGDPSFDTWRYNNPGGRATGGSMAGQVAIFDSDLNSVNGGAENVALESPALNTTSATKEILEYDVHFECCWGTTSLNVEVYNGTSWVLVKQYSAQTNATHETLDISASMANVSNAKVRFRWVGDWAFWAIIDNVKITQTIPQPNDIAVLNMETFQNSCGKEKDTLAVRVKNAGTAQLTNIGVDVTVTGAGSANYSIIVPGPLTVGKDSVIKFPASVFNTLSGGTYNVTVTTTVTNDGDPANNNLTKSFIMDGTPDVPITLDIDQCGNGIATLTATKGAVSNQLAWYDANMKVLAQGKDTFKTGVLGSNAIYTYYVDASNVVIYEDFTGTTAANQPAGWSQTVISGDPSFDEWRFDNPGGRFPGGALVSPFAVFDSDNYSINGGFEDVTLETPAFNATGITQLSLEFDEYLQAGIGGTGIVEVWNGTAWKQVYINTVQTNGVKRTVDISADAAGVNGFKVRFRWQGNWAWYWIVDNIKIIGGSQECRSAKKEIKVNVKGLPTGASATKGSTFQGTFTSGIKSNPDIVTAGDEINYDFIPPTGFTNATHGSDWQVTAFSFTTVNGVAVPPADYTLAPPVSSNGTFKFTPTSPFIDSLLVAQLTITDLTPGNGCDSVITRYIFVAPKPEADFNHLDVCFGDGMAFDNLSNISTGSMSYLWVFGDGETSALTNPIHKYNTFGNYDVTLYTTSNYGYVDSSTVTVQVFETPNVAFKHKNACDGIALEFTNNTTIGAGTLAYTWSFGDNTPTSGNTNETHLYTLPGEYIVTLSAEANNCKASVSKSVFQFPQPDADFTNTGGTCNETEIEFTSTSTIAFGKKGHYWDFGDMVYSTEENPKHTFQTAGINDVKLLVVSEFGCKDSATKTIILKESPVANFTNTQVCDIDPVEFTNTSTVPAGVNVDYTWTFGDGNSSMLTNPTHNYSLPLKRLVTLVAEGDNGCTSTISKEVQVGIQPQADFSYDPVCEDELTLFVNGTTISRNIPVTYEWYVNGNPVSNATSLDYVFDNDGISKVKLVATANDAGACKDEIEKDVQVDPTPDCNFTVKSAGKGNRTTDFTVNNPETNVDYQWQFGDGAAGSGAAAQYRYPYSIQYTVILTATAPNGCSCSDTAEFKATTVSVKDVDAIKVDVYPNPNKGNFTVKIENAPTSDVNISVYNTLGEVVYTMPKAEANSNGEYDVKLENMPAGIYTVKVQSGDKTYTSKINVIK